MTEIGFSAEQYIEEQSKYILERINCGNSERLYLEFGGKLVQDKHAMRVLPGFDENAKIKLLQKMKDKAEIIICIYSGDIMTNKTRQDFGITYDLEVLRLMDIFRKHDLVVNSVVVTRYEDNSPAVDKFINKLERRGIRTYKHRFTKGYPTDVDTIVSDEGYGANPYIEVERPLVVVTGPGGGSGKLATCLSQLYHENKRGRKVRYAKFETFPIWNIPLKHPVNVAYEAATADLKDVNMIDSFHLEAYGETTVNYNRDVEIFPVLEAMFERIFGECPYKSPTDMGVNMAGNCIIDDEVCQEASRQEIIRRYYQAKTGLVDGSKKEDEVFKLELLMKQAHITPQDRKVVSAALNRAEQTGAPAAAMELPDGKIITGKTSDLLGSSAALLLNALKELAGISHETHILSPAAIEPIQILKTAYLGSRNPRLHTDEILIALSSSTALNPAAQKAMEQIPNLKGCQVHTSVMLSQVDIQTFKRLGIQLTCEPIYEHKSILHNA